MTASEGPLIAVRELRKTYGKGAAACHALRGISFSIDQGEWVSIVGHSGTQASKWQLISSTSRITLNY